MGITNNALVGASGNQGYNVQRSLRFRSSASAYLSRTPASAGNRKTWTWSGWVKLGATTGTFLSSRQLGVSTPYMFASFNSSGNLTIDTDGGYAKYTNASYRDYAAWYHIVLVADTTNTTGADRFRVYVNGSRVTNFSVDQIPTQNADTAFNSTQLHTIGNTTNGVGSFVQFFDGYLAEVNFIDGQALTPTSFGQTDAVTGVWQPKKYTGTYGTNGFYLPFSDNTSATTLAYDKSGNGNNWTPINISTTAGATYDSMTDVPTLTSATAANYCVMNPIMPGVATGGGAVAGAKDGNLLGGNTGIGGWAIVGSTMTIPSGAGKYYFECTVGASGQSMSVGVQKNATAFTCSYIVGNTGDSNGYSYSNDATKYNNGGSAYGSSAASGDVIGIAVDASSSTSSLEFYKNGVSMGVAFTGITGDLMPAMSSTAISGMCAMNFGQRPFSYTPPTGFKALNTFNLPDPTIKKPNQYMDASLYAGNNSTQTVTNSGSFQPDLVWIKNRTSVANNWLMDSVRTATYGLQSNTTNAESTVSPDFSGFTSTGFSLNSTSTNFNGSGNNYVGWQWKKGATPGFDIVTYTGNQTAGKAVPHSLGVAPAMIIVKARGLASSWPVYHKSLGATNWLLLNSSQATTVSAQEWDNQPPSASNFYVGNSSSNSNQSTAYVAYLFSEIAGFSKFGSYTGNGSADGPFVYCGFRPKYVMIKCVSSSGPNWWVMDTARDTYNLALNELRADVSNAELTTAYAHMDILSNGFKLRSTSTETNGNGSTHVFAAFAESPFKFANAR